MTLGAERSLLLVRAKRILIVAVVLVAGLIAAWPFRQDAPASFHASPAPLPLELTLRRQEVALSVSAPSDQSPATGLEAATSKSSPPADKSAAAKAAEDRLRLEHLTPPPELPVAFHASSTLTPSEDERHGEGAANNASGPDLATNPGPTREGIVGVPRPKVHYLRDGDTLEALAERFLGNRERAVEIYEANRGTILRPDLLPVGKAITIPPRQIETVAPAS